MSASVGFHLPPSAEARLDTLVDSIEANPGPLLNPAEMRAASDNLNVHAAIEQLPEGITEEDFVGVLRLAMLTECATDSYSAVFQEGAEQFNAPWLGRFNERIWTPDEHTHHTPYKYMLQSLGYSEEELDLTMHEVRERHYEHCCGRTPVELTTYGIIQEYLTDNWHGMISQLLKPSAPYAAKCASMVKRRETLHTTWYREMTAIQVEENPEIMGLVADTVLSFQMPGTQLVPELGARSLEWMGKANVDFSRVTRDFVRHFQLVAGTMKRAGQLFVDLAAKRGMKIGPVPLTAARQMLGKIGGPGYGLIGEAVLDKFGLPRPTSMSQTGPINLPPRMYEAFRSRMRGMIMQRIDTTVIIGEV